MKKTLGLIVVPVVVGVGLFLIGLTIGRNNRPPLPAIRLDLVSPHHRYVPLRYGSGAFKPGQVKFTGRLPLLARQSEWFLVIIRVGTAEVSQSMASVTIDERSFALHRRLTEKPEAVQWLLVQRKADKLSAH